MHVVQQIADGILAFLTRQLGTKSKLILVGQELRDKRRLYTVLEVLEQILEHTAGGTGSGNELEDLMPLRQILLPSLYIGLLLGTLRD